MTTNPDARSTGRALPLGKLLVGMVAGFALALAFGVGALLAYDGQYAERIHPGVTVAGVDVSGLTRETAAGRLESALAGYGQGSAAISIDGEAYRVPYATLGRHADVARMVELAWSVGRGQADPVARAAAGVRTFLDGVRIGPLVTLDEAATWQAVNRLAVAVNRAPVSASANVSENGFASSPAIPGSILPREEVAADLLARLADPAAADTLVLSYRTVAVEPFIKDAAVTDAVAAAGRMAQPVTLAIGTERWTLDAATVRGWIRFETTTDGFHASVDPAAPVKALKALASGVNRAAKEASFVVGGGSTIVRVRPGANGRALDVGATASLVAAAVTSRAAAPAGEASPPVAMVVTTVEPKLTTAEAQSVAPRMRKVSSWTTYYEVSERNGFGNNITIPARDLDGTVVAPGAVFDFWSSIGPVTYARGYRDGGVIIDGHSRPTGALAGGICSTSTTLFNAVARAGYQMLARRNHYYYISRYPTGLDATVAIVDSAVTTMSWRNDSAYPVMIRSSARPGVVTFSIYAVAVNNRPPVGGGSSVPGPTNVTYRVANGRTVTFWTSGKSNYQRATSSVQRTTALAPGQVKVVEYADDGFDITVTRSVSENGKVIRRDTWTSHYARVDGLTYVGVARR